MKFKPFLRLRLRHSDVPRYSPVAIGCTLSQLVRSVSRRLTWR